MIVDRLHRRRRPRGECYHFILFFSLFISVPVVCDISITFDMFLFLPPASVGHCTAVLIP